MTAFKGAEHYWQPDERDYSWVPQVYRKGLRQHGRAQVLVGALPPTAGNRLKDGEGHRWRPGEMGLAETCEIIERYCRPGGVVWDGHGGTGTVALAAMRTNRICWYNDIDGPLVEDAKIRAANYFNHLYQTKRLSMSPGVVIPPTPEERRCMYWWTGRVTERLPEGADRVPWANRPLDLPADVHEDAERCELEVPPLTPSLQHKIHFGTPWAMAHGVSKIIIMPKISIMYIINHVFRSRHLPSNPVGEDCSRRSSSSPAGSLPPCGVRSRRRPLVALRVASS